MTLCSNGALAVAAVQTGTFAAVLMDMQMPIMDGLEATRRIRLLAAPKSSIPIIAMTANVSQQDQEKCLAAGMNAHIGKPIEVKQLTELLAHYLPLSETHHLAPSKTPIMSPTTVKISLSSAAPAVPQQLVGIDLDTAIKRVNGNWPFLYQLLRQFIDDQQDIVARVQRLMHDLTDEKNLIITLHTLKGTAANLGATALSEIAAQMEHAAKNQRQDLLAEMIPTLDSQWQQLVNAIHSISVEHTQALNPATKTVMSNTETQTLLADLQPLLDSDLAAAQILIQHLIDTARDQHLSAIQSIQQAFINFDIDQTKQLLNQYSSSILSTS